MNSESVDWPAASRCDRTVNERFHAGRRALGESDTCYVRPPWSSDSSVLSRSWTSGTASVARPGEAAGAAGAPPARCESRGPVDRLIDGLWAGAARRRPSRQSTPTCRGFARSFPVSGYARGRTGTRSSSIPASSTSTSSSACWRRVSGALGDGDRGPLGEALQQALGLWRGPALAEFAAEPFAASEGARLEELHLLALEARIEADLALGPPRRDRRRARAARLRAPAQGALLPPADARVVSLGSSGRGARRLPGQAHLPGRSARHRAEPELHELEGAILRQDPSLDQPSRRETVPAVRVAPERPRSSDERTSWSAWPLPSTMRFRGLGRLVMVSGEQGIGKTRVAMELAAPAEQLGAQVLWGRCYEREGAPPYWPWVQVIRAYAAACPISGCLGGATTPRRGRRRDRARAARALTGLGSSAGAPRAEAGAVRPARFAIASFLVQAAAAKRPLAIVLDDLHAADAGSLLMLEFVARELEGAPLLVVGTYRDVELTREHRLVETLAELTREDRVERLSLRGLTEPEVASLVEASIDAPLDRARPERPRADGGEPPVRHGGRPPARDQEDPSPRGGPSARGGAVRVPEGVRVVIGRRLDRLSANCCDVLRLAALVGREFDLGQLRALAGDAAATSSTTSSRGARRPCSRGPRGTRSLPVHASTRPGDADHRALHDEARPPHARIAQALEAHYGDAWTHTRPSSCVTSPRPRPSSARRARPLRADAPASKRSSPTPTTRRATTSSGLWMRREGGRWTTRRPRSSSVSPDPSSR